MNERMVREWNEKVSKDDVVLHLGDFALCHNNKKMLEELVSSLNGKIEIIFGSHDKDAFMVKHLFHRYYTKDILVEKRIGDNILILSHHPMLSWPKRAHGSIHFFGHVHTSPTKKFLCQKNSYDCGVDNNGFAPILLEEAIEKAKNDIDKIPFFDQFDNIIN